jgi:Tfp pilus assembly protein PilE
MIQTVMRIRLRDGFSFLDMMMYLSIVALSYHYAIPCYKQLVTKMRAQELIKIAQQAQLQINEHALLQGHLPEQLDFDELTSEHVKDIAWNGETLDLSFQSSTLETVLLSLQPSFENFSLKWDCYCEGSATLQTYVCYALT